MFNKMEMIGFDPKSFIYEDIIFVNDPNDYVNLDMFLNKDVKKDSSNLDILINMNADTKGKNKSSNTKYIDHSINGNIIDDNIDDDESTESTTSTESDNEHIPEHEYENERPHDENNDPSNDESNELTTIDKRYRKIDQIRQNTTTDTSAADTFLFDDEGIFIDETEATNTHFVSDVNIYQPTSDDLAFVDSNSTITSKLTDEDVSICHPENMINATPIWKMNTTQMHDILSDFDHYKDAKFAVAFAKKLTDVTDKSKDLLSMNAIDVESLQKFKVTYIDVPTVAPKVNDNARNGKRIKIKIDDINKKRKEEKNKEKNKESNDVNNKGNDKGTNNENNNDNINNTSSQSTSSISGGDNDSSSSSSSSSAPTRKIPLITFTDHCLFKTNTIFELRMFLAFHFCVNVTNVFVRIRDVSSIIFPHSKLVTDSQFKWEHLVQLKLLTTATKSETTTDYSIFSNLSQSTSSSSSSTRKYTPKNTKGPPAKASSLTDSIASNLNDLTDKTVSIGSAPIIVTIIPNYDSRANIYEEVFLPNYVSTTLFCNKLFTNVQQNKTQNVKFTLNISQINVKLVYKGPLDSHTNINIVKLFNINHINEKCSKIYINSKILDEYNHNPRQLQYVKLFENSSNFFKGVDARYNTCSFYMSDPVIDLETSKKTGIVMHHIDVSDNMNITFVFNNMNIKNRYEYILDMIQQYLSLNAEHILRKINVYETIYNTNYIFDYYVPVLSNITASFTINNAKIKDLNNVVDIMNQDIPILKFSTRTSIYFTSYSFYNISYWYQMLYLSSAHDYLTTSIVFKDNFPATHCILNPDTDELTVTLNNMSSYDNLVYCASAIIGLVEHPKTTIDEDIVLSTVDNVNVETIRKSAMKYDKKLLKLLTKIDPVLFGPRYIGTKNRSYSGLCQKKEQRPIPITEHEYNELMKHPELNESLVILQNQTFPDQTICLFCADKEFKFLNYHHFPNQKCIVRCTSKPSNKTQYDYCRTELGAQNWVNISNRYENQTITLYNSLITPGRKCRIPEEIKDTLTNYILLKVILPPGGNIEQYCLDTWNKHAFVIQRCMTKSMDLWVCNSYYIKTDYYDSYDYVLILESESNVSFFVFITEGPAPVPLFLSDHKELKQFFVTHVKKLAYNNDFLRFVEDMFDIKLENMTNMTIRDILNTFAEEHGFVYIMENDFIKGVLKNETVYLTPTFYWVFPIDFKYKVDMFTLGKGLMEKKYKLPLVTELKTRLINAIYIDYGSQLPRMVLYNKHHMLVQPFEITAQYMTISQIQFDYVAKLMMMANTGKEDVVIAAADTDMKSFEIGNIINTYIYIYLMTNESITKKEFFRYMAAIGVITNDPTNIKYCDKKKKRFISWRKSKINKDEYLSYTNKFLKLNTNELISINYDIMNNEMKFNVTDEELIMSKIITS